MVTEFDMLLLECMPDKALGIAWNDVVAISPLPGCAALDDGARFCNGTYCFLEEFGEEGEG